MLDVWTSQIKSLAAHAESSSRVTTTCAANIIGDKNRELCLQALRSPGVTTRRQICDATGLAHSTVSAHLNALKESGAVGCTESTPKMWFVRNG